jgi:hypothetical protein
MKANRIIGLFATFLVAMTLLPVQSLGGECRVHGITERSLNGTYFIPCAEEGNVEGGGSIHVAGMGKVEFDGKGNVTITQEDVYTEVGTTVNRLVMDGQMVMPDGTLGDPAQFSGYYKVNAEGFGQIFGDEILAMFPPEDHPYAPSFLITEIERHGCVERATAVYMVIPQNFVDPPSPENSPKTLIHVTARLR